MMYFKKQPKIEVKPRAWRNTATLNLDMQKEMKDMLQAKTDTNDKQCIWGSKINEPLTSLHLGLIKQGLKHIIFAHE